MEDRPRGEQAGRRGADSAAEYRGAADGRNLADSEGQQGTTKIEVSGRFTAIGLGRETAGLGFHTAEARADVSGSCPTRSRG
jgi:hypothetical protein